MITPDVKRSDGTLWQAGYSCEGAAMASLFGAGHKFYFRKVEPNPARKWWTPWRSEYVATGEVWQGSDMTAAGFSVIGSHAPV